MAGGSTKILLFGELSLTRRDKLEGGGGGNSPYQKPNSPPPLGEGEEVKTLRLQIFSKGGVLTATLAS